MYYVRQYISSTYGSGTYSCGTYENSSSTTCSTTGASGSSTNGTLADTGLTIAVIVTVAALLIFLALLVRFFRRKRLNKQIAAAQDKSSTPVTMEKIKLNYASEPKPPVPKVQS